MNDAIRFVDGAAYERYMGEWSKRVGTGFLDWLAPDSGRRWLDVGCGNGAFTELLIARTAPAAVDGVDPSAEQIAYAQAQPSARIARYQEGDAMALPYTQDSFDAAVMPLVIFFVPQPARGVAEMTRVVMPGGSVSAYAWDMDGGGFPYEALNAELRALGVAVPLPPHPDAARVEALHALWSEAGLVAVTTRQIVVQRTFADFDEYWNIVQGWPSLAAKIGQLSPEGVARLQATMRTLLPVDASGRITCDARANAVKGLVPEL